MPRTTLSSRSDAGKPVRLQTHTNFNAASPPRAPLSIPITKSPGVINQSWNQLNDSLTPDFDRELKKLGSRIRHLRELINLTQKALAAKCNFQRTYLADIERGARNVGLASLTTIAHALDTTVSEVTTGLEEPLLSQREGTSKA